MAQKDIIILVTIGLCVIMLAAAYLTDKRFVTVEIRLQTLEEFVKDPSHQWQEAASLRKTPNCK